jgi:hypothetical protein
MTSYILIRRLMGPSILLLLGIVALLSQANVVHFTIFFPLLLILIGVIKLAERAALAAEGEIPPPPWGQYPGAPGAPGGGAGTNAAGTGTAIVSSPTQPFTGHPGGDES